MLRGMLFTEVPATDLPALVEDNRWVIQQKMDGTRAIITVNRGAIKFWSRAGQFLKHAAAAVHFDALRAALEPLQHLLDDDEQQIILDGELLIHSGTYHVFDVLKAVTSSGTVTDVENSQEHRYRVLKMLMTMLDHPVYLVRQAETQRDKASLARDALLRGVEGIVAKRADAPYEPGARVRHTVKVKFVKSADVVVMEAFRDRNEAGREIGNITFGAHTPEGDLRLLGRCSIIGKPHVDPGDVIEIAYLKFESAPVQPRMMRVREDKSAEECTLDQFPAYSYEVL